MGREADKEGKDRRRGRKGGGQDEREGKGIEAHTFEFCQIESSANDDDYVNQHCCDIVQTLNWCTKFSFCFYL